MISAMLEGSLTSIKIFMLTLLFSLPLGLPIAFARMSKFPLISAPANLLMLIMRGTPLILQLIFFYFVPYYIFGFSFQRFTAVIIAFR